MHGKYFLKGKEFILLELIADMELQNMLFITFLIINVIIISRNNFPISLCHNSWPHTHVALHWKPIVLDL
jgi:hypothetical protein